MNTQTASFIFGIVFILVGILGFVPNPLVAPHGVFAVVILAAGVVLPNQKSATI